MTREEAIHFAECLKNNWTINFADMEEFCDMAIEALQNLSKPNNGLQGSDLISRDVVLANIDERIRANGYGDVGLVSELNRLIGYVRNIPSAEADRPTKHTLPDGTKIPIDEESYEIGYTEGQMADRPTGEWVECESNHIEKIYSCSNCKTYEAWGETEKTPYCPNCGARMGGNNHD